MNQFCQTIIFGLVASLGICNPALIESNNIISNKIQNDRHLNAPDAANIKQCLNFTPLDIVYERSGQHAFNETFANFFNGNRLFLLVVENFSSYKMNQFQLFKGSNCNSTSVLPIVSEKEDILIFKPNSENLDCFQEQNCDICGSVVWQVKDQVTFFEERKRCVDIVT